MALDYYPIYLDKAAIEATLPHRGHALLLDKGEVVGALTAKGWFTFTEESYPMFAGHFPGHPIIRGVDLIEACGLTASLVISVIPECAGLTGMFREASGKFLYEVGLGDTLAMEATIVSYRRRGLMVIGEFTCVGKVGDKVAVKVTGKFIAAPLNSKA